MIEKLQAFFDSINMSKKFPGYFNKRIFQVMFILMFSLVGVDFYLNGMSFYSFGYECQGEVGKYCVNEFYDCANWPVDKMWQPDKVCRYYTDSEKDLYCVDGLCDKQFIPTGFKVGRTDILAKQGALFILYLVVGAFVLNHLVFMINKGRMWPERVK